MVGWYGYFNIRLTKAKGIKLSKEKKSLQWLEIKIVCLVSTNFWPEHISKIQ